MGKIGYFIFTVIMLIGFLFMGLYTFFGLITLVGLIALVETVPLLRWIFERTANIIDVLLFALTIFAIANFGVTITASLTIAGLGFTLAYKPFLKARYHYHIVTRPKHKLTNVKRFA